ncbi:hypothetical protein Esti_000377 [Eimeria stiedai]
MAKEESRTSLTKETGSPVSSPRNFSGKGRAEYADGSSYEGEFVRGRREGVGVYVHSNGDTYEGPYKQGKRHGLGKLKFAAGGFFHGSFVEGRREGLGCQQFANGDVYYGEWKGGRYHGEGCYTFKANKQQASKQIQLKGEWEAGSLVSGSWVWRNNTKFEGLFCGSKPQGAGRWLFPCGTQVRGVYRQLVVPLDEVQQQAAAAATNAPNAAAKQQVFLSWETQQIEAAAAPADAPATAAAAAAARSPPS